MCFFSWELFQTGVGSDIIRRGEGAAAPRQAEGRRGGAAPREGRRLGRTGSTRRLARAAHADSTNLEAIPDECDARRVPRLVRWRSFLFAATLAVGACPPAARMGPCANDGQCDVASGGFRFCAAGKCVECRDDSACGKAALCANGACVARCEGDGDCPDAHACLGGVCVSR